MILQTIPTLRESLCINFYYNFIDIKSNNIICQFRTIDYSFTTMNAYIYIYILSEFIYRALPIIIYPYNIMDMLQYSSMNIKYRYTY